LGKIDNKNSTCNTYLGPIFAVYRTPSQKLEAFPEQKRPVSLLELNFLTGSPAKSNQLFLPNAPTLKNFSVTIGSWSFE